MAEQKPIDDEMLWGEPDKTVHDNPGRMTQEEIEEAMMLWAEEE